MTYVNENEFTGYITRGPFGTWKVLITGHGIGEYEMPMTFRGWSRRKAIFRAERWCRRIARAVPGDEHFRFDPTTPSAGFETRR